MRQLLLPLAAAVFLGSCARVPVTGRRALHIIPDAQMSALADGSYRELIAQSKLSTDPEATAMVRRVGERIAAVANKPSYKWEFNLIDEAKTQNAFCMPGGKVAFYTGILPITQNEAGVAVVMGHEVAHAIAQHGGERMSQMLVANLGLVGLDIALQKKPQETRQMSMMAMGLATNLGILKYSRSHESEADRIGLIYMAQAGYDPREAVAFWERMGAGSKGKAPPEFISTHPSHATRIRDLQKWMPEALAKYEKAKASR